MATLLTIKVRAADGDEVFATSIALDGTVFEVDQIQYDDEFALRITLADSVDEDEE